MKQAMTQGEANATSNEPKESSTVKRRPEKSKPKQRVGTNTLTRDGRELPVLPVLDTSFNDAATFIVRQCRKVRITLVGTGGTGSYLAAHVARLARVLQEQGKRTELLFIDPDYVEEKNVPRSNFCHAEIGQPKAHTLARRYAAGWGIEIASLVESFQLEMVDRKRERDTLNIVVGCVDNAAARRELAGVLDGSKGDGRQRVAEYDEGKRTVRDLYLDCGNMEDKGQVLLGTVTRAEEMRGCLRVPTLCTALPSPAWQHPELLEDVEEELADNDLSCAELMMRNAQSLMVNQMIAGIAADYLSRLLLTKNLQRYATYYDLQRGSGYSLYTTPKHLARTINRPVEFLTILKSTRRTKK